MKLGEEDRQQLLRSLPRSTELRALDALVGGVEYVVDAELRKGRRGKSGSVRPSQVQERRWRRTRMRMSEMMGAAGVMNPYWVNEKIKRPAGSIHAKHMAPIRRYSGMGMPLFESRLRS